MGIEIKVKVMPELKGEKPTFNGIESDFEVSTGERRVGSIEWGTTDDDGQHVSRSLIIDAKSNSTTPQGGSASIGGNLYFVDGLRGPQSIDITQDPLKISLRATDK